MSKAKYVDGTDIRVGDVFTDGYPDDRADVRLKNRGKVLYVDNYTLVWFPLNDFTTHTDFERGKWTSNTWCLSGDPKRVEYSELTEEEREMYNTCHQYLFDQ